MFSVGTAHACTETHGVETPIHTFKTNISKGTALWPVKVAVYIGTLLVLIPLCEIKAVFTYFRVETPFYFIRRSAP